MIGRSHSPLCIASLGISLSAALSAQALTIADGNMSFTTGVLAAVSHSPPTADLRSDPLAVDHAFEHGWFYRVAGDARELSLRNIGPVTGGVTPFLTHADRDFGDVDSRGLLRANIDFDTYDAGPTSGVITSRLTMVNISLAPVTLDLFCYNDLDIGNTFADDVVTGNGTTHVVTDWTGVRIEIRAPGADHSDVLAYPAVRNALTNVLVDNLSDSLPPFSGDYTGAFQWSNRTLQPGEQRSWTVIFAVDTAANRVPIVAAYGSGSHLAPEIYTDTLPLQDNSSLRQFGVHLKGALPNAPVGLASNTSSAPGVPFLSVVLWVDPNPPIQFPIGMTTASGESGWVFVVPSSPYLTGFPIYHQWFYADNSTPNGVAGYTGGLMTEIGRL